MCCWYVLLARRNLVGLKGKEGFNMTDNSAILYSLPEDWVHEDEIKQVDEEEREHPDDEADHHLDGHH